VNPKSLPVDEYLRLQGRFNHLSDEDIQKIQETVDREWERLLKKALDTI
jgi:pyruvate/2-oxoacid:ferredoxin oxidoreductase beta subunit